MRTRVPSPDLLAAQPRRWLRLLAQMAAAVGALWLVAWLAVPWVLKSQLERHASEATGRVVRVDAVHFSPWSLELELLGLRMGNANQNSEENAPTRLTDETSQLSIQRVYVDAELASVFRRAPVLDAVRIEGPVLQLSHLGQGQHNLQDVLDRLARPRNPPEPDTGPARLAIYNIQLTGGEVAVTDVSQNQRHTVNGIELSVPFISTLGLAHEVRVTPKLAFRLNGSVFETEGNTQPFNDTLGTQATLNISGLDLEPYLAYLPDNLAVRPSKAVLGAHLKVEFAQQPRTSVRLTGQISADGVTLTDLQQRPLLQMAAARVELADVRPLERVALLGNVELTAPRVTLSRDALGRLNVPLDESKPEAKNSSPSSDKAENDRKNSASTKPTPAPWTLAVAQFKLSDGGASWTDALMPDQRQPPASTQPSRIALTQLQVQAKRLQWPLPRDAALATEFDATAQLAAGGLPSATSGANTSQPSTHASAKPAKPQKPGNAARATQAGKPAVPASLTAKGSVLTQQAQGTLGLAGLDLGLLAPYIAARLAPTVQGQLAFEATATWKPAVKDAKTPDAADDLTVQLNQLKLSNLRLLDDGGLEAASLQALDVRNAALRPLASTASLGQVSLTRPVLNVQRDAQGHFMFERWLKPAAADQPNSTETPATETPANPQAQSWSWQLPELTVTDGQVGWRDALPAQAVALQTSGFKLQVNNLASRGGPLAKLSASARVAAGQTEPGTLSWQGTLGLGENGQSPEVTGQLDARRLPVHALAPYAADQLNLGVVRADTSYKGNLSFSARSAGPALQLAGDVTLEDFEAHTTSAADSDELLRWKTLNLKGLSVALAPATATQVSVQSGALSDFFARIVIQPDGRINLQNISKQAKADADRAATTDQAAATAAPYSGNTAALPPRISIGPFSLVNGSVDFSDKFIRPNYRSNLTDLTGRLGGFSSEGAVVKVDGHSAPQMAELELRGKAEGTASLEIVGKLNPLATPLALDIEGRVRDLELPPLSPYTIKYTGHGIERGKLSLDVAYTVLPNGQLTARNQLVLNQLTFGEPVAGATTTLPVRLAVALLADRHGVIDLNLPISGSLNDPEFSLVPIVFKVIGNIIVKAITAPFALLTGALGGSADELSQVAFVPGTARLEPGSTDKLSKLAQALIDKPNLKLTVVGAASLEHERNAFQRARLQALVVAEQARSQPASSTAVPTAAEAAPHAALTGANYTRWLTAVYKRTDMPKPRNAIGMAKDIALADMEALLLAQIAATETQMQELAVQRGVAVRDHLARLKVPTDRLFLGAPTTQTTTADAAGWRPTAELKLAM